MSTDELERKLKEKDVELIRLPGEGKHLRSEQRELLNKLKQKQVLNREKVQHYMKEPELDNQVGEVVVGVSSTMKVEPRIKEEKYEGEEEQK